jgi:hypothetical protein
VEDHSTIICVTDGAEPLVKSIKNQFQLNSLPKEGFLIVLTERSLSLCDAIGETNID